MNRYRVAAMATPVLTYVILLNQIAGGDFEKNSSSNFSRRLAGRRTKSPESGGTNSGAKVYDRFNSAKPSE